VPVRAGLTNIGLGTFKNLLPLGREGGRGSGYEGMLECWT
jgi:hypothetical protein